MQVIRKNTHEFLYQQVISFIEHQQRIGVLRPGDKLPSLRKLSRQFDISVPTVKQAYLELERQGTISARPQSGYYLKAQQTKTLQPRPSLWHSTSPVEVKCRSLIEQVHDALHMPNTVALGISNPINCHPPDKSLARLMRAVISKNSEKAVSYGPISGCPKLRLQLAYRYQEMGVMAMPDEIIITNGAQEALSIALQSVAKAGDIIAIESPCFFGIIELIESLDTKALEVYTCPEKGVCIDKLSTVIKQHNIKACLFSTAINNPLGSMMSNSQRQAMVQLLEKNNIVLIEDDVYSDLYFNEQRPKPAQYFSEKGLVITCSSFSKTAAPGYRIGWLMSAKFEEKAKRIKRAQSCSTPMLQQWTLTEYLLTGEYDRHLALLRKKLIYHCERMKALIAQYFPDDICISNPQGGSVLWIRCRSQLQTTDIFAQAIKQEVSFTPGVIFSPSGKYKNYMRISFGVKWNEKIEQAVAKLGKLLHQHSSSTSAVQNHYE